MVERNKGHDISQEMKAGEGRGREQECGRMESRWRGGK